MLHRHFYLKKGFLGGVLAITLPIALQNVISLGVNLMDTVMLGQLGDIAITAANLGGQPFSILNIFGFGFASGAIVLISQYWGKGDTESICQLFSLSLRSAVAAAAVFTAVCAAAPQLILRLFSPDPAVIEAGSQYLRVLSASFILFSFSNCYIMCLRGVEQVKISIFVYGTSFFVNVFFNYCFIFGNLGMPELGVRGAALGTVIARAYECAVCVYYMCRIEKKVGFTPRRLFGLKTKLTGDYARNCLPVTGNELLWGVGLSVESAIIGRIGSQFVAASSIATVVMNILTVFIFGMAGATAVTIGRTIGQGRREDAARMANTLLVLSVVLGACLGGIMLLVRTPVLTLFSVSAGARAIAYQLLTLLGLLAPLQAFSCNLLVGVLRGGGDVKTNFLLDCGTMWVIAIPMGLLSAFVWGVEPALVFLLMRADYVVKFVLGLARVKSGKWIRIVTR